MDEWKGINEGGLFVLWNRIKQNFVSSIGVANDKITWSKGGTAQTAITVPYATKTNGLNMYNSTRNNMNDVKALGDGMVHYIIHDNGIRALHFSWDLGAYDTQISIPDHKYDSTAHLKWRSNGQDGVWENWITILDSDNSSVSKSGETLTVKINGTSQSLTNTNTHRSIQLNGTEILGNNTTALNLKAGTGVSLTNSSGTVTFKNSGVRAATINGNYLRINTNGTNADLTIPYATNADLLDGQHGSYYATASSVTTLQGYFTDEKAKKAIADGDGNTISTTYLKVALKGAANGLAELDANGLVASSQLPSYVDDVLEYASKSAFPATGTAGKIYVALDTNLTYRWSGSAYTEISPSLALGETSSTAYRGDRGKTAYTHATDASRLTTAKSSGFYKFGTTAEGHIASVTAVTASDLTTLIGATTYAPYNATGYQVKVSKLGSTTKPLYTSAAGTFAECSTYAGGTAVTLNGTSKAASTASFYAPTEAGTSGQILKSSGSGAPTWVNQSTLTAGALTTVSKTAWGRTFWTANGVPDSISGNMDNVGIISINNQQPIRYKKYQSDDFLRVLVVSADNNLYVGPYASGETCTTYIYGKPIIFRTKDANNAGVLAATIDANKNFTSQGSVVGMQGVAAYGIADLSIISNT